MMHAIEHVIPRSTVKLCLGRIQALSVIMLGGFVLNCAYGSESDNQDQERAFYSADALGYATPPLDLLLSREGERRAEAQAQHILGLFLEEEGAIEEMITAFRRTLDLEPANVDLAEKVAFELVRHGDVPGAIDVLKDAAKAVPDDVRPSLYLGGIYERDLGKHDLALKFARRAQKIEPDNPAVYRLLHEILISSNRPHEAAALLDKAALLDSDESGFWLWLAEFQTRQLMLPDSTTPKSDLVKLIGLYEKVRATAGGNLQVLNAVADFYVYVREVKRAIPLYLEIMQSEEIADDEFINRVREKLARSLLLSGERKQAIGLLEEIVKKNPLHYQVYEFLGRLYEGGGEYAKALPNYQQCLLLNPSRPLHSLRVADMHLRLGQADKAVRVLKEAHQKSPNIIQISYSLAVAYSQLKNFQEALTMFESTYLDAQNDNPEFLTAGFYFNFGVAAEQAGLMDKAAGLLKQCITLDPENAAQALNYLGYMWADRGVNLMEAQQLIQHALELDPSSGAYVDSLGWVYFKQGKYAQALVELLRAEQLVQAEDPVVFDHIAEVYKAQGDVGMALVYWQKALLLVPNDAALMAKVDAAKQKVTAIDEMVAP